MIRFVAGSYKGVKEDRQKDVYRLLHIAFDHGCLFDAGEIEAIWEKATLGSWSPLPENDEDTWDFIEKNLPAQIVRKF
jgi:hypothetical protein